MNRLLLPAAGLAILLGATLPGAAQAQVTHRHVSTQHVAARVVAPPLTVTGRSWLDMGTAADVGTQDSYRAEATTLHEPVWASYLPDRFGRSTLPRQFSLPFEDNPRGPESGGIFGDF